MCFKIYSELYRNFVHIAYGYYNSSKFINTHCVINKNYNWNDYDLLQNNQKMAKKLLMQQGFDTETLHGLGKRPTIPPLGPVLIGVVHKSMICYTVDTL